MYTSNTFAKIPLQAAHPLENGNTEAYREYSEFKLKCLPQGVVIWASLHSVQILAQKLDRFIGDRSEIPTGGN
jgi:hypothetical protein